MRHHLRWCRVRANDVLVGKITPGKRLSAGEKLHAPAGEKARCARLSLRLHGEAVKWLVKARPR